MNSLGILFGIMEWYREKIGGLRGSPPQERRPLSTFLNWQWAGGCPRTTGHGMVWVKPNQIPEAADTCTWELCSSVLLLFLFPFAPLRTPGLLLSTMSWVNSQQLCKEEETKRDREMEAGRISGCFLQKKKKNPRFSS